MTQQYSIWSLATQKELELNRITIHGTGNEDGSVYTGSCTSEYVQNSGANMYRIVFENEKGKHVLCKDTNGNIKAKVDGTSDPAGYKEIVLVPDKFKAKLEVLIDKTNGNECLTTDSKGNLSFKAFDENNPQPDKNALLVVSEHT